MRDPVPRVRLAIQRRALNIYILELRIKVYVSDCCRFAGLLVLGADLLEEGRGDEVHILFSVSHHALLKSKRRD